MLAGRTLEEAFALQNLEWIHYDASQDLKLRIEGADALPLQELHSRIYELVREGLDKTDFALTLIADPNAKWASPAYIVEGLVWLHGQLRGRPVHFRRWSRPVTSRLSARDTPADVRVRAAARRARASKLRHGGRGWVRENHVTCQGTAPRRDEPGIPATHACAADCLHHLYRDSGPGNTYGRGQQPARRRIDHPQLPVVGDIPVPARHSTVGHQSRQRKDCWPQGKTSLVPCRTRKATKDKDAANLEKLQSQQRHLSEVRHFTYGIASDFSKGVLGHEDVIRLATDLITDTDLLPRVIASKHPYIFVDESQDTYQEIVMALKRIVTMNPGRVRIGFFGDPAQQIYQRGVGHIQPEPGWEIIKKPENFRSSNRVLDVINAVRSKTDDLIQTSGRAHTEQLEGETFFFVLPAAQRRDSLDQVTNWLNANSTAGDWRAEGTKILTITHRMAATRLGFEDSL